MTSGADAASSPRRPLRLYLAVFFAVLFGCMAVTGGHLMSPDEELLYRQAESMALGGRIDVRPLEYDPESRQLLVPPDSTFATVRGRGGRFYTQYLPLQSALAAPLVWLGKGTESLFAESFNRTLPHRPRHFTQPHDPGATWRRAVVVLLFNPLITALTAVLLARMALFITAGSRSAAVWTAALYAFGTMALPHSRTYFTEPLAGLFALIALDQLLRWYRTPLTEECARRRLLLMLGLGGALAGAIWTRMDSPFLALGIGLTLVAAGEWKRRRESAFAVSPGAFPVRDYAVSGALCLGAFGLLLGYNHWRFAGGASLLGGGYVGQEEGIAFSTPLLVGLHGFLASPGKGIFFFSPALLLAVWGWFKMPRHLRWVGLIALGAYVPFAISQIKWQNWDGGWCWGPRHIYQLHAPIALGTVFLFLQAQGIVRRALIKVGLIVGVVAQLIGSLQSPMDFFEEFFLTPRDGLYFQAAYRPAEAMGIAPHFAVYVRDEETGRPLREVSPAALPAPMVDSLYLPHHTQWVGNLVMLRDGQCDLWLLARLLSSTRDEAAPDAGAPEDTTLY